MMKISRFALLTLPLVPLCGCQNFEKKAPDRPQAASAESASFDVRTMRTALPGKSMSQVVRTIGRPTTVYTIDEREFWQYESGARDSITGRPIKLVEIVFRKRIVESVNFSIE